MGLGPRWGLVEGAASLRAERQAQVGQAADAGCRGSVPGTARLRGKQEAGTGAWGVPRSRTGAGLAVRRIGTGWDRDAADPAPDVGSLTRDHPRGQVKAARRLSRCGTKGQVVRAAATGRA